MTSTLLLSPQPLEQFLQRGVGGRALSTRQIRAGAMGRGLSLVQLCCRDATLTRYVYVVDHNALGEVNCSHFVHMILGEEELVGR